MKRNICLVGWLFFAFSIGSAQSAPSIHHTVAIHAACLFNGTSDTLANNQTVVVTDDRLAQLEASREEVCWTQRCERSERPVFRRAVKAGAKIAFELGVGPFPHSSQTKEFAYMVGFGMTPAQAARAATSEAAKLKRWEDRVGSVEVRNLRTSWPLLAIS